MAQQYKPPAVDSPEPVKIPAQAARSYPHEWPVGLQVWTYDYAAKDVRLELRTVPFNADTGELMPAEEIQKGGHEKAMQFGNLFEAAESRPRLASLIDEWFRVAGLLRREGHLEDRLTKLEAGTPEYQQVEQRLASVREKLGVTA